MSRKWLCSLTICVAWTVSRSATAKAPGLRLLAVGDWGGHSDEQPTTKAQVHTAKGMAEVAHRLGAVGVVLLGDNFYLLGVDACTSRRFKTTFRNVYAQKHLKHLPFFAIAGNHDHRGNVTAQVNYASTSRMPRWHFPSQYYGLPFNVQSSSGASRTVQFLMLDTVDLAGLSDDDCVGCPLLGPRDTRAAEEQWAWLEHQLQSSTADFLFVAGHYPIYSAGEDGTTDLLVERLLPMLKAHGAHYLSGHDHMAQHIVHAGVHMFVSGMGMECCYNATKRDTVPSGALRYMIVGKHGHGEGGVGPRPSSAVEGGFIALEFDDAASVTYYDQDGTALYTSPALPPRTQGGASYQGARHAASSGSPSVEALVV